MLRVLFVLGVYVAAVWWLQDHGRTNVPAVAYHRAARVLQAVASGLADMSMTLDLMASAAVQKRSLL